MLNPAIRMASDYNRGLPVPVRWAHVWIAAIGCFWRATFGGSWWGRQIVVPALLCLLGFLVFHPFDLEINRAATRFAGSLSGDLRRELFAWQQFGQGFAIVLSAVVVWLVYPARRRRLLDLALAVAAAQLIAQGGKMLVGRPRPRPEFDDAASFLGPWGEYPITLKDGSIKLVHAWDTRAGATTDLWSMPSSHTLFATMLAVFLAAIFPRLRPVLVLLVLIVGLGRIMFDAHWATDVIVGAAAGYAIGAVTVRNYLGIRLLDALWKRFVDPNAMPAAHELIKLDQDRA